MSELTIDERAALEALFGSEGWAFIVRDVREQIKALEAGALNAPSFEALLYNRGVRDTLRVLEVYDRILGVQEPDDDSV